MTDKPIPFHMQRARPIRGPGIVEQPKSKPEPTMVTEPPRRKLRKPTSDGDGPTAPEVIERDEHPPVDEGPKLPEQSDQPSVPIADVLNLMRMPKTMELITIFTSLHRDEARYALHLIHKMFPELFR